MVALAAALFLAHFGAPADPCAPGARAGMALHAPAPDLYCVRLFPGAAFPEASGVAHLLPPPTPFGVAVTREGLPRLRIRIEAEGLPDPGTLGPHTRYVAWLTSPSLHPMVPLGELEGGRLEATVAGLNSWLLLVSAEGPDPIPERTGPLVLRGTSPSMVLRPHDMTYILGEMVTGEGSAAGQGGAAAAEHGDGPTPAHGPGPGGAHRDHPGHGQGHHPAATPLPEAEEGWIPPAMHPLVPMPHQMMALRPGVRPLLPQGGAMAEGAGDPNAPGPGPVDPRHPRTGPESLPRDALPRERVHLAHGDTLELTAGPVSRLIGGRRLPGYGFNGQIPGPLLEAEQGATIHVRFRNDTPLPSAIHWHGLRLDAPSDGVPGVTQDPVPPGGDFLYHLRLPDEGTFWYHPHLREDVAQDLGLAGNLRVHPSSGGDTVYAPVAQEIYLVLDDHLVSEDGRTVPYGLEAPTHALMGRFGNVLLVNGQERIPLGARPGDVLRVHLTNAASVRTFNLSFGDLPMKLVASDLGRLPRESWVESVVVAPAERWVVEVRFPESGAVPLENRVQALDHVGARFLPEVDTLALVEVAAQDSGMERRPDQTTGQGTTPEEDAFSRLRSHPGLEAEMESLLAEHLHAPPHRVLELDLRTRDLPFPLDPLLMWESVYRPPVEWSGTMPDMDWLVTGREAEWILRDPETGAENMDIRWHFPQGERVRLRIVNRRDSLHPMQHPIHLHGQRFLVLAVNGEPTGHPAWKDTVLVPVGAVVDLLLELDNPGPWMLHCHIAEHMESGMMTVLHVDP